MKQTTQDLSDSREERLINDLDLLSAAVRDAGEIALKHFGKAPETKIKPDGTEVSAADLEVNDFLEHRLTGSRPDYGWLSEESEKDASKLRTSRVWIIDPIDGTRGFLKNSTDWTIAAALTENGHPTVGVVFAPARDEFYSAAKGLGATLNGAPIQTTSRTAISGAKIIAGRGLYKSKNWQGPWDNIDLIWSNSMAYRVCLVAKGDADATISISKKSDWDIAGAQPIIEEAGGKLTNESGVAPIYNKPAYLHDGVVAAGTPLSEALIKRARY